MLMRINEVKIYSFKEFREIEENRKIKDVKTIDFVEKAIEHIKRNKAMYVRLVFATAIILHLNMDFVFANDIGSSLDSTFGQLVELLKDFAKWGCLGMGLKRLIEEMLAGGSFKQASSAGAQYWLCYLFIQFYPKLFNMIKF